MTQDQDDGWDRIYAAFGEMQGWLCKQDVINHAGWSAAWDFSQNLFTSFTNALGEDGRYVVEVNKSCNPQELALLLELATGFERLNAPAFLNVSFDLKSLGVSAKHLLNERFHSQVG